MSGGEPRDYTIEDWMGYIENGEIQIPEFQRGFVWDHGRVVGLIVAMLKQRPVGSLLALEVATAHEASLFRPRGIRDAIIPKEAKCRLLILDGQQRLTALWHALKDTDPDYSYFLEYPNDGVDELRGYAVRKPASDEETWIYDEKECIQRKRIPIHLLAHSPSNHKIVRDWINRAYNEEEEWDDINFYNSKLDDWISQMSERILSFRIPYLSMPGGTTVPQAIDTFVQFNTSAQQLKKFDLIVGIMLDQEKKNLRELRDEAWRRVREIRRYINEDELGDLILKIGCLRQGILPTESNYKNKDVLNDIAKNIDEICEGIRWTCDLLNHEFILSSKVLPSHVPLRVLPALHRSLPNGRKKVNCEKLARRYLWRAFFTNRYSSNAAGLLFEDYKELCNAFQDKDNAVPIFDENWNLPNLGQLMKTKWPSGKRIAPRAILALSLRKGAQDLCYDRRIDHKNIDEMEAHHIFPRQYLRNMANIGNDTINVALNCMLIKAETNRKAGSKPPIEYLSDLYEKTTASEIGESDIKARLMSHLIPADILLEKNITNVKKHYEDFLHKRAKLLLSYIESLSENGENPT